MTTGIGILQPGLTGHQVAVRLAEDGPNVVAAPSRGTPELGHSRRSTRHRFAQCLILHEIAGQIVVELWLRRTNTHTVTTGPDLQLPVARERRIEFGT